MGRIQHRIYSVEHYITVYINMYLMQKSQFLNKFILFFPRKFYFLQILNKLIVFFPRKPSEFLFASLRRQLRSFLVFIYPEEDSTLHFSFSYIFLKFSSTSFCESSSPSSVNYRSYDLSNCQEPPQVTFLGQYPNSIDVGRFVIFLSEKQRFFSFKKCSRLFVICLIELQLEDFIDGSQPITIKT